MTSSIPARIAAAQSFGETNQRANEFLALARVLLTTRNDVDAARVLRTGPFRENLQAALTTRAAVPAALTTDSTWAGALTPYAQLSDAFGESLRSISAFDRVLSDGAFLRVPPQSEIAVTTALMSASLVGENAPKPATVSAFTQVLLAMSKCSAFVVISSELARAGGVGAINLLRRELSAAVSAATDAYLITQLLTGLTAIPSSGGASAIAVRQDLRVLLDAVSFGAAARLYYLTTPALAKRLSTIGDSAGSQAFPATTPTGGTLDGIPLIASDAVSSGVLILFDASQVAVAAGPIELDRSDAATLVLDSAPDSPPIASSNYQALWSQNMSALRAERYLSAQRLRTTAAASISGVTGIGNSPS